ncbi:C39 family peptidase [Nocardia sp. NPDC059239]|uniref:C39 family peptidase n=1 Tax=Nocardia sp. NPDC059239 TaxID=3346785 RepID=UPI0036CD8DE1
MTVADMALPVPYYSQWESPDLVDAILAGTMAAADDPRWPDSGASSAQEYQFWSWRTCGVACLRMVLAYRDGTAPDAASVIRDCLDVGAYIVDGDSVRGLIYAPFSEYLAQRWGLSAQVEPSLTLQHVRQAVAAGRPTMLSVHPSIRRPSEKPEGKGGHLVLAVGASATGLIIHNPSGLPNRSQQFATVDFDTFENYFAGRGIVIDPTLAH